MFVITGDTDYASLKYCSLVDYVRVTAVAGLDRAAVSLLWQDIWLRLQDIWLRLQVRLSCRLH